MKPVSVSLRVTTSDLGSIREWFQEYGTPKQARMKAVDLLAEYVTCQLISNAEWDGQSISIDFAAAVQPANNQR